ncbi:MAG TPA: serine hydrolase domain-containing protein [Microthrixaceae bacterium]|nr:serine hydrolase domain-containing protein [Microthrixaceae bacterium]
MTVLGAIDGWGASFAAAAVVRGSSPVAAHGDACRVVRVASITKLLTAWAALIAVEEGATTLDTPLGPPGSTVRHLLAHAGGYDFDSDAVLAAPGTRRIYSNTGYELLARHIGDATGFEFADYMAEAVLAPLGMGSSELRGSAARDLWSDVEDLLRFAAETRAPTLLHPSTVATALAPAFAELDGVLPGWGPQRRCWWGLGPELKGDKDPHWSGSTASPNTYGHFGGSGTFLWVDPAADLTCVVLTDREFGDWAVRAWPGFSERVRSTYSAAPPG